MGSYKIVLFLACLAGVRSGYVPNLTGGRAQYFYVMNDGGYKYGYSTGDGSHGQQKASSDNQVEGSYGFNAGGEKINLKYTSGVQGFVPDAQALERLQAAAARSAPQHQHSTYGSHHQHAAPHSHGAFRASHGSTYDDESSGDASYRFSYNADSHKRQEQSDSTGNVRGSYAYSDDAGSHDLEYVSGPQGFMVVGGSLSEPNGLVGKHGTGQRSWSPQGHGGARPWSPTSAAKSWQSNDRYGDDVQGGNTDASYKFGYSTDQASRQEAADSTGNVKGSYSYTNEFGTHDLSYVAGAGTGFRATGGSLATANGLSAEANARSAQKTGHGSWQGATHGVAHGQWQSNAQTGWQQKSNPWSSSSSTYSSHTPQVHAKSVELHLPSTSGHKLLPVHGNYKSGYSYESH